MPSLFISHSSQDNEIAEQVMERLKAEGFVSLFLDFDPQQGIPAGRDWEEELYAQLRKCDGLVFLLSQASAASKWCFHEIASARDLKKPIFPLLIERG